MTKKNKSLKDIPILVLGFNRSYLFNNCVKRLKSNSFNNIWVAIDGPRLGNKNDQENNKQIRYFCKQNKLEKEKTLFVEKNLGCRNGVKNGISWFFENNLKGIIIEDDIEIDNEYLKSIADLLNKFQKDKQIFSISSYSESCNKEKGIYTNNTINFFKSPLCRVWGWATWRDRWEKHLSISNKYISDNPINCFFSLPKRFRTSNTALRLAFCKSGKIDTWDYEWNFSHIFSKTYSITPIGFFSLNYGFGPTATHTKYGGMPWAKMDKGGFKNVNKIKFIQLSNQSINNISKATGFDLAGNWLLELVKLITSIIKISLTDLLKKYFIKRKAT